jgi:hypothetical protein
MLQLALHTFQKRRSRQQCGDGVDRRLLTDPTLVFQHSRPTAQSGKQLTQHQRLGQEVVDSGLNGISQRIHFGVTNHQEGIGVAVTTVAEQ